MDDTRIQPAGYRPNTGAAAAADELESRAVRAERRWLANAEAEARRRAFALLINPARTQHLRAMRNSE
jgi:hypothetical protein